MFSRRDFLSLTAAASAATALHASESGDAGQSAGSLPPSFAGLTSMRHLARPITTAERQARIERARSSLQLIAQVIDPRHPPAVLVRSGTPAEEIADVAASMEDLVIVVGLGGGWMLHRPGSTAYRVLCLATVPVFALPPEAIASLSSTAPMVSHARA